MGNKKHPLIFGIFISILLIVSFLIFASLDLHTEPIYSLINGVIMAAGIFISLQLYKNKQNKDLSYQDGFQISLLTGMNSTIIFTGFFAIYSYVLNPEYIQEMFGYWHMSIPVLSALTIFSVFVMGMATSVILTLTYMQLFKKPHTHQMGS
ncbi:DUF4199 domain-containing protein [Aquimarina agarivorans]|uniref:DUF4199 domain-containing protein n=1 Tax=Aquimarina agarivorans TaxID=980584 RepID=UPI000248F2D6|nr:DUF4199 domain-containing protein [Aquimarina agarivorans]